MSTIVDTIQEVRLEEIAGEIRQATRVLYLDVYSTPVFFNALSDPQVPQAGDALNADYPNVKVIRRIPTVVRTPGVNNGYATRVRIEIQYELQRPRTDNFALRGGSSLQQIETGKKQDGSAITLTYNSTTYPVRIPVLAPQGNLSREIEESTNDPDAIVDDWVGHVNSATWRGGSAKSWLCTNVTYELIDRKNNPKRYRFTYEFEKTNDPDGWKITEVYKDSSGRIPSDVDPSSGNGIVTVDYYPTYNFGSKFS